MNIENIKADLAMRVQNLMATRSKVNSGMTKTWKDKVADTDHLVQKVYETLYEILQTNGIEFSSHREFDGLISLLEPSVNDIIIKNIED
ncbi:hypothetical protein SAMN05192588_2579 [Nonlabens sp. Hel1_33_55]|uniref:hypothetical protein n=1 Tax=Nonlabens sp. Hel1_33_55 TaxID=1336802 RepID=UPI000875B1E7|nr:hypothetical protein [Nonlabens sp. Hel1_33_55]SCY38020.1 hypothetical protein SAMN05192588_2579 [Nonlabens sp. Hel1_33_55]